MANLHNLFPTFPGGMKQGTFPRGVGQETAAYQYFLPGDIFQSKDLNLNFSLYKQMEDASLALGGLASLTKKLPNLSLFIKIYTCLESALSSRIEGKKTKVHEAFMDKEDVPVEKRDDWAEVDAHIRALEESTQQLKTLPLCNRVLKQTHHTLLSQVRGKNKLPGKFRTSPNWIGGSHPSNATFVPPAFEYVEEAMSNLEKFIQDDSTGMPHLIKAALIHYQFETIHPFLDGNGRVGRILILLYLINKKLLPAPILSISNFFEARRTDYYDALDKGRRNPEGIVHWISFFLDAIYQATLNANDTTQHILDLRERLERETLPKLGRRAPNGFKLLEWLFAQPVIKATDIQNKFELSPPVAQGLLKGFVELGILEEITGYKRNRLYAFEQLFTLLEQDKHNNW